MYTKTESKIVNVKMFKRLLKRTAQNVYGNTKLLSELQRNIYCTNKIYVDIFLIRLLH